MAHDRHSCTSKAPMWPLQHARQHVPRRVHQRCDLVARPPHRHVLCVLCGFDTNICFGWQHCNMTVCTGHGLKSSHKQQHLTTHTQLGTPVLLKCAPQDSVAPRSLPGRVCITGITLQRCGSSISCLTGITRDSVAHSLSTAVSPKVSRSSLSQVGPSLHIVA